MSAAAGASQRNRRKFIQESNSHGPYLWSGADIENALLWFTQSTKKQQQRGVEDDENNETIAEQAKVDLSTENEQSSSSAASAAAAAQEEEKAEGCEFLRSLLHSRGIWNPRPSKLKKKRTTTNLADDNHVNKRKRKRKRKDDSTNGGGDNNENDREEGSKPPSSPLQSVLMGYYQLFQKENVVTKPLETSLEDGNNNNSNDSGSIDKDKDTAATTTTTEATLRASSKLYDDLSTIILSRQRTQKIYSASLHTTPATNLSASSTTATYQQDYPSPSSTKQRNHHRNHHRLSFQMTHKIDQYVVHPTTCARRVYASGIYDRLLHLSGTTSNTNNATNNATNSKETEQEAPTTSFKGVQKFLQKLFGLAMTTSSVNNHNDGKIQEVILLLVLEPLRRFQVQQQRQRRQLRLNKSEEETNQLQQHGETDLMDLFPLLTSQIMGLASTSSSAKNSLSEDATTTNDESSSSSSSSPLTTLLIKSILHTNSDTWWSSQPSPLLCTISHYHFPIAHKYIQYWFNKALVTHASCYKHEKDVEEYHHAVERLQEFYQTSHRLREYLSHVICNLEKEVVRMSSLIDDEVGEEDEVFKTSIALRAVKRALGM